MSERYRVEQTGKGFWPYCVRAGNGTRDLYVGHKKTCDRVAAELRARVVVLPSVDNVMNIVMRYQWNEKTNVTGTTNWAANLGMRVVEEVKRLNGKTVSEGLLREVVRHLGNWLELHECECDGGFHYCGRDQVAKTNRELRALLNQDKENGNG